MLAYFGEPDAAGQCGNCDTCLTPPSSFDGTIAAQKLLSAVLRLDRERNQRFGAGQVIDILLGRQTDKITRFRHDQLSVFGIGTELSESEWRGAVRQLLAQGLLAVEGDYGTLLLTDASRDVLGKERQVMLRRDPPKAPRQSRAATPKAAAAVANLSGEAVGTFERLRAWRAATAKEQGVPAYVIFHDATLRQFANDGPRTLADLGKVSGVGENKLAKYGQQVLDVLAESMPAAPAATPGAPPVAARGAPPVGAPTATANVSARGAAPAAGRAATPAASSAEHVAARPATPAASAAGHVAGRGATPGAGRAAAAAGGMADDDLWGDEDLIEPDEFE
jgi:ATP-dependent DNA helicase RecQ